MNKDVDKLITQLRGKTFSNNKDVEVWLKGKICSLLEEKEKETSLRTKEWIVKKMRNYFGRLKTK